TLARVVPDVGSVLSALSGLSQVEISGRQVSFEYEHDETAAAELLKALLARSLPVAKFGPVEHDLEQAYLRTGIRQVD
ncbi:MAG: hypothetical protein ACE5F9_12975, partial [Phycisphaerae bacterium]